MKTPFVLLSRKSLKIEEALAYSPCTPQRLSVCLHTKEESPANSWEAELPQVKGGDLRLTSAGRALHFQGVKEIDGSLEQKRSQ